MTSSASSTTTPATSKAVLVTAPRCAREESDGAIRVDRVRAQSIDLTYSPSPTTTTRTTPRKPLAASIPSPDLIMVASNETQEQQSRPVRRNNGRDGKNNAKQRPHRTTSTESPILALDVSTTALCLTHDVDDDDNCSYTTHLVGKSYHPKYDYAMRRTDESSLFWFTYRCDFSPIHPYNITTDAGWGCMLRSAQMMLGQVLRLHYKSREWVPPSSIAKRQSDPFVSLVLTYFADFASTDNVFSLHNMVAAGVSKYEILPGEWYGPGTACHVMRDLVHMQEARGTRNDGTNRFFRVHVASQGSVYRDTIEKLMTREAQKQHPKEEALEEASHALSHPLDPKYDCASATLPKLQWDTALLILIPLRLGLQAFNEEYAVPLAHVFSLRQSVGVLGGRPRGARWFYGADSNGSKLYGLDPHTIQMSPQRKLVESESGDHKSKRVVALTEDYIRSVHTSYPETMNMGRVDPSLALGFYCLDRSDFDDLCASLLQFQKQHANVPELFTVADAVPDYSANVSCVMNEMMAGNDITDSFALDGNEGNVSDEDEYVML